MMLEGFLEGVGLGAIGDIPRAESDFTAKDYIPGQPIPVLIRDPQTKKVSINPLKRYVRPFWLVTDPPVYTMFANEVTDLFPMLIDGKGHFEIVDAFFKSSREEGFTVEIFNAADIQGPASGIVPRPTLMNREVHVATIASGGGTTLNYEVLAAGSNAGRPYRWPCTHWISADTDGAKGVFVRFRNLANAPNTIRFALHGRRWYHTQAEAKVADRIQSIYRSRARVMPFFYTTDKLVSIPGGVGTGTFNAKMRFDDVSWTEVFKMSRFSAARFLIRIVETATTKRLMGGTSPTTQGIAIRDDLVFGDGEFPFLLWESNLFEPNFSLIFEMTNQSASANVVWITLGTRKIMFDPQDTVLLRPGQAAGV
jgi:hypothetical protein